MVVRLREEISCSPSVRIPMPHLKQRGCNRGSRKHDAAASVLASNPALVRAEFTRRASTDTMMCCWFSAHGP